MQTRSDIPHVLYGAQQDYKRLYYSEELAALKVPVTLQAGYGVLRMGIALSKNLSAAGNIGKCLPYNPTSFTGVEDHPGRAYLVADNAGSAYTVNVSMEDSYKFAVGDDLIINDDTTTAENLGAITEIDRTTYATYAVITHTTVAGATPFTTARFAYVCVEAGTNTNLYSDGVGILEKSVDTCVGQYAKGALATLILGNCVLNTGMLTNVDSAFKTDVSASTFGNYTYIR